MSHWNFNKVKDIIPNWVIDSPFDNIMVGRYYKQISIEFIVRKYISGSLWRSYRDKHEDVWDLNLPDGLVEDQELPNPIITPTN